MGLLSHRVERSEIEAGDHILYMENRLHLLSSWFLLCIYVGGNKVGYFTCEQSPDSRGGFFVNSCSPTEVSSLDFSSSCPHTLPACTNIPDCGFKQPESGVILSCLVCFIGGGSLYCFEYRISPLAFLLKLRGSTCTTAKPDIPKVVIHRAMYLLHNGFGNYDVFENNCEDFALYCKTGLLIHDQEAPGKSGQVYGVLGAPLAAVLSSPLWLFMSSPLGMATAGASLYCLSRYAIDIGVRDDVIKVEVEDIFLYHGSEGQKKPAKIIKCCEGSLSLDQKDGPSPRWQRCQ